MTNEVPPAGVVASCASRLASRTRGSSNCRRNLHATNSKLELLLRRLWQVLVWTGTLTPWHVRLCSLALSAFWTRSQSGKQLQDHSAKGRSIRYAEPTQALRSVEQHTLPTWVVWTLQSPQHRLTPPCTLVLLVFFPVPYAVLEHLGCLHYVRLAGRPSHARLRMPLVAFTRALCSANHARPMQGSAFSSIDFAPSTNRMDRPCPAFG